MTATAKNEKAARAGNLAADSQIDTKNIESNHSENLDFSKADSGAENSVHPGYIEEYLIIPLGATAKNQFEAHIKPKRGSLSLRWRGGKKLPDDRWEKSSTPYYSVPKDRKNDLLEALNDAQIPLEEIEFRSATYQEPPKKHVKKALKAQSIGDDYNEKLKLILEKEQEALAHDRRLVEDGTISQDDLLDRAEKIRTKFSKQKGFLTDRANRNFNAANTIYEEGEAKEELVDSFVIEPGKTHVAAAEGRKILSDPKHGVFQRSGQTVWLSSHKKNVSKNDAIRRTEGSIQIAEVDEPYLIEKLSQIRPWSKFDARSKGVKSIDYPSMAARMILSRNGEGLLYLKGFINAPTVRLDGSLLTRPGYDEETGLFFDPLGTQFHEIPDKPTKDDAIAAASVLVDLISEFPFEDEVSKSVALSELMTSVIRRSLPLSPIFANDASTASSGKSLIAKLGSYISTGKAPTMVSPSRNEEEMRKRLAACLMDGDPVLCIDNVDFPLESRDLCIISTSETWRERILGVSKNAQIETNTQIIITGNNLSLVGDICTRTLKCRLVPMVERPEERRFARDLNLYIPTNRGALAMAVLTIIRAYIAAGQPNQTSTGFREYTDWCRLVRDPLLWIGYEDPCESIRRVQALDPKRTEMEALFGSIKAFPADSFTSKQLIDSASNKDKRDENDAYQQLYDALIDAAGKKDGTICPIKLGHKLKEHKDRIWNGMRLKEAGKDRTNKTIWKLVSA